MTKSISLKDQLTNLLTRKRSKEYYAKVLGITVGEVEEILEDIKGKGRVKYNYLTNKEYSNNSWENIQKVNLDNGTIEVSRYYDTPPTPEQVIADHQIDTKKWKLSSYWSKQKSKGYQVSALFTQIHPKEEGLYKFSEFLTRYKSNHTPLRKSDIILNNHYTSPSCALISLPDLHFDKEVLEGTTIKDRCNTYFSILEKLLYKSYKSHYLDEIVFVVGNDLYHTDNIHNQTTKGTQLYVDVSWDKIYEVVFELMVKSICKLKQFCNKLKIVLVQGNHSRTKEFYLAHALEVYFKEDKSIVFDRSSDNLKVHTFHSTALFFNHGDNINDKLPLAFATTFYKEWGRCKYKEIILGDKHHNAEKIYRTQGEANGVRMRILPTLSGTDNWHKDNLFINSIPSGICLIYDKEMGKCAEFEERHLINKYVPYL